MTECYFMNLKPLNVPTCIVVAKTKNTLTTTKCGNSKTAFNGTVSNVSKVLLVKKIQIRHRGRSPSET